MAIDKIIDDIIDEMFDEVMPELSNPHPLYQKFVDTYSEEEIAALIKASEVTVKHPIFSHEESIKFKQLIEKMRQASKNYRLKNKSCFSFKNLHSSYNF